MSTPKPLVDHVVDDAPENYEAQQWQQLQVRLPVAGRRALGWRWFITVPIAVGAALLFFNQRPTPSQTAKPTDSPTVTAPPAAPPSTAGMAWLGNTLEVPVDSPARQARLRDGSAVHAQPGTILQLVEESPQDVRLVLQNGIARFDVTPNPDRRFVVETDAFEVTVIGTAFEVDRDLGKVRVLSGIVRVSPRDQAPVILQAGQQWPPVENKIRRPRAQAKVEESETAAQLFREGLLARRQGQLVVSASKFARVVAEFARDRRAPLAALELGRLRMDALSDASGAIAALRFATSRATNPSTHQDALARLIEAFETEGHLEACAEHKRRYLKRYPNGVHAPDVQRRCKAQ